MPQPRLDFEFTCPLCGGHTLELPEGYNDSSMATCGSCGTDMARWGDIKAAAAEKRGGDKDKGVFKGWASR
jgi:transcription elongation factor Elf1